jgi:hypothetical protein
VSFEPVLEFASCCFPYVFKWAFFTFNLIYSAKITDIFCFLPSSSVALAIGVSQNFVKILVSGTKYVNVAHFILSWVGGSVG